MITERDIEVLQFIQKYRFMNGFSPCLREICDACYMSKPTAKRHIDRLVENGYITYKQHIARSYVVKIPI